MDLFGGEQRSDFVELARRFCMQLWTVQPCPHTRFAVCRIIRVSGRGRWVAAQAA
jgi:hypothetical protein